MRPEERHFRKKFLQNFTGTSRNVFQKMDDRRDGEARASNAICKKRVYGHPDDHLVIWGIGGGNYAHRKRLIKMAWALEPENKGLSARNEDLFYATT